MCGGGGAGSNKTLMAHKKKKSVDLFVGSRMVGTQGHSVSKAWPDSWAHSLVRQAGTTAVQQDSSDIYF